jgi:hypothetical protein
MGDSNNAANPMDPDVKLFNEKCEDKTADKNTYLSLVGPLMYVALGTRPDIAFAVTALSRYNLALLAMHLTAAKKTLCYLKTTRNLKLHYGKFVSYNDKLKGTMLEGFTRLRLGG